MNTGKRTKRRRWIIIFPVIGVMAGLFLLLFPYAVNKYNEYRNSQAITSMSSVYDRYEENSETIGEQLIQAQLFNKELAGQETSQSIKEYEEQLTFDGDGVMGYLTVPEIDLQMIIYHGTSDDTLAVGCGHLEGTSLPVGGESTHAVLTAHSGMKTMKAFDDLRKLETGDRFYVTVLGTEYWYEVESIETVLPEETDSLQIVAGEDRMTLVTCTPYGINDHRLLVHGIRIETPAEENEAGDTDAVTEESANQVSFLEWFEFDIWTTPVLFVGMMAAAGVVVLTIIFIRKRSKKTK